MRKIIREKFAGKDLRVTLLLIFSILGLIILGCGGSKTPSKPIPSEYFGDWKGQDGSTISIRGDGTGDYRSGGFHVDGGKAEMSEDGKSISLTVFGLGKTLKIDQAPSGGQMKLDGVTYTKNGGSTSTSSTTSDSKDTSGGSVPSDSELKSLVKTSIQGFTDAVESEDFTDFYDTFAGEFKKQYTADSLKTTFDVFIKQKDKLVPLLKSTSDLTPTYSPAPAISNGVLSVNGVYNAKQPVNFELRYIKEDGEWKLSAIRVKT